MSDNKLKDILITLFLLLCGSILVIVYFLYTRENLQFNAIQTGKRVNIVIGKNIADEPHLKNELNK